MPKADKKPKPKKATKPKPRAKKKAPRKKPGPASKFHLDDRTRTWLNPKTQEKELLPPLQGVVDEMLPFMARWELLNYILPRYGCSEATVDRAIKNSKQAWDDELAKSRRKRIVETSAKLAAIAKAAKRDGQYGAARATLMDRAKLAGDFKEVIEVGPAKTHAEELTDDELAAIIKRKNK